MKEGGSSGNVQKRGRTVSVWDQIDVAKVDGAVETVLQQSDVGKPKFGNRDLQLPGRGVVRVGEWDVL